MATHYENTELLFESMNLPHSTLTRENGGKDIMIELSDVGSEDQRIFVRFKYDPAGDFQFLEVCSYRSKSKIEPTI